MNPLKNLTNSYLKWFLELVVIFLSVVLAFFFDDYRENKNENSEYKKTLLNFTEELIDDIDGRRNDLDSFRVASNNIHRGRQLERLLNLLWFESKLDKREATMTDLEYLIKSRHLSADMNGYGPSPLSEELRTKFGEQIDNRHLVKWLRIYEQEMKNLLKVDQISWDAHVSIYKIIEKINPTYKFTIQDSLQIYSNEFIWRYKDIVMGRKEEYYYDKWLVQKRLKTVFEELSKELDSQELSLADNRCATIDNFELRFKCENGRPINNTDSLKRIEDIVETKRNEFISMHQNKSIGQQ